MGGIHDHSIDRNAEIRRSKLDVFNQEAWFEDFIGPVADPIAAATVTGHGLSALVEFDRSEAGAAGANTAARADDSSIILETDAQEGDFIIAHTEALWRQAQRPELHARVRLGQDGTIGNARMEIGFHSDTPAGAVRNSPVGYATVVYETDRELANFYLAVAGSDYVCLSLDESAAAAGELTDETADAQDAGANDVPMGVAAAQANGDGLIFLLPRPIGAVVVTIGTVEAAVGTYAWQYWNGTAWTVFVPSVAPIWTALGRAVAHVPAAIRALMVPLEAGDVVGVDATTANSPVDVVGHYGVRCVITAAGAGAPALISWLSVEENIDLGVSVVDGQWHDVQLRIAGGGGGIDTGLDGTAETAVQAQVDQQGWNTVGTGALDASIARNLRAGVRLQTLAAEAKRLDLDAILVFQGRAA